MRRVLTLALVLLTTLLAVPSVTAQTPVASPEATPAVASLDGLEYVAVRQYAADPSSPITPGDEGIYVLTVRIYVFDSEASSNAGWESTIQSTAIEADLTQASEDVEFSEEEIDDLGDRAWVTTLSAQVSETETGYFRLIYVQDGTMLYTVNAIAGSAEPTLITDDIARMMVVREPGDGDVQFNPGGTSSGGVWEILPPSNDDLLDGLIPFADGELALPD